MKWIFKADSLTKDIKIKDKNNHFEERKNICFKKSNPGQMNTKKAKAGWTSNFEAQSSEDDIPP